MAQLSTLLLMDKQFLHIQSIFTYNIGFHLETLVQLICKLYYPNVKGIQSPLLPFPHETVELFPPKPLILKQKTVDWFC